jgi:L-asparaginase
MDGSGGAHKPDKDNAIPSNGRSDPTAGVEPPSTYKTRLRQLMGKSLQPPAGRLWAPDVLSDDEDEDNDYRQFIPQIALHEGDGRARKRVLVLCTGGTLTMAPDPNQGGALAPVEGALSQYMREMPELHADNMPEVVLHEYFPFYDSSDLGPADWARLAHDIRANYLHFDGFVIVIGTDTMAYSATALSFMLENLGKPVIFTGSQIPMCEPYNDGRRNLIMALIFASRDTINEVSIFFHDRLLRACRATKVNTHRLLAFDSPNQDPLATIGITIDENEHLVLPPAKGALRVHSRMDTRVLTIRLVPGFDDAMIREMINHNLQTNLLRALVLQLYGTGNIPSVKESFIQLLADASDKGILVVASTQCYTGSVMMGHYAVGKALESAGVVSAADMTQEAIACKVGYLYGRGDLSHAEASNLMGVSLRGEITPQESLSPPPLSSAYQRGIRKGKRYY